VLARCWGSEPKKKRGLGQTPQGGEVGCLSLVSKYETRTLIPVCFSKLGMVSGAMKSDHQKRLRTPASWAFLPDGASAVPGVGLMAAAHQESRDRE
jgi:hypothetical protein